MSNATSPEIKILVEAQQRRRQIHQLASALILAFSIPDGYELVCHLSTSPCRNNREALIWWIQTQCVDHNIELAAHALPTLITLFANKLDSIQINC